MANKIAILVANDKYENTEFNNLVAPHLDAASLQQILSAPDIGGYDVKVLINLPSYQAALQMEQLLAERKNDDQLLFYFSGHGIRDERGRFFFVFPNTRFKALKSTAISSDFVNDLLNESCSKTQILLLDCCFSGAFIKGMKARGGMKVPPAIGYFEGDGRVIITATNSMQYAFEGKFIRGQGIRSVFTQVIVKGLRSGEADQDHDGKVSTDDLYKYICMEIRKQGSPQTPMKWESVTGQIYLAQEPVGITPNHPSKKPSGRSEPIIMSADPSTRFDTIPKSWRIEKDRLFLPINDQVQIEFCRIPAGDFLMGDNIDDKFILPLIVHLNEFWIGKFPITVEQFSTFITSTKYRTSAEIRGTGSVLERKKWVDKPGVDWRHPSRVEIDLKYKANYPVTQISWDDAVAFCQWISIKCGLQVRLPSEAEWEKAARGTDGPAFPWGGDFPNRKLCNFAGYYHGTTPMGTFNKVKSAYGCEDMAGNVWEWTNTLWGQNWEKPDFSYPYIPANDTRESMNVGGFRILRGGAFFNVPEALYVFNRIRNYHEHSGFGDGFRVGLSLPSSKD